jgi:DNA-damage-inducible protein D
MTDLSLRLQGSDSPFDSLRRVDENGNEYWNARELMPLLGYSKWYRFKNVIEIAKENLETVISNIDDQILSTGHLAKRPQGGGNQSLDYRLTRLASYHIALSCDSRGNEQVKLAKHYFAIKTREAEVQQQKPKTALELAKEQVALLERLELQQQIIEDQEKDLLRQAEVIDELFDYSSIIRIAKYNNVHENSFSWRMLKAVSIKMDLEIKKVPSPRFGYQLLYPHDAWRFAYPNVKLPETTTLVINS